MMIGQFTADGPRWSGRSDGWKQIEPCVGVSRAASGTNTFTKAMIIRSALNAASSSIVA